MVARGGGATFASKSHRGTGDRPGAGKPENVGDSIAYVKCDSTYAQFGDGLPRMPIRAAAGAAAGTHHQESE
jgi:hypothetical protein